MKIPQGNRTFLFGLFAVPILLDGAWLCRGHDALYSTFAWSVVGVVALVAGKHSVESLAGPGGGGIKGAVKALFTEAQPKPADPPAPPEQP